MEIIWLGHSCFRLTENGFTLVIDPYYHRDVMGYPALKLTAEMVLCSHEHYGHNYREAVTLRPYQVPNPFEIETIESSHDVLQGRLRGPNTVHIIRAGGLKIIHLGDLGCALTPEQEGQISDADALMTPVGGILTIDAAQAHFLCERVRPRVILPMHFGGNGLGNRRLHPPEEFTGFYEPDFIRLYDAPLALGKDTPPQVAMFSLACAAQSV
ncbi:MAG: MBL fold metallo-hydrolase [Oscillospiraceae bacterium]